MGKGLGPRTQAAEGPLLGLMGDWESHWGLEPTFLAQNHRLLMQAVHVSGPQSGTTRTPVSWVSWV